MVNLKHIHARQAILTWLLLTASVVIAVLNAEAVSYPEYENYVHVMPNSLEMGNWTYMEKPMFPVSFNDSQVGIGENWSILCPLKANHTYHVYCYGNWIDNGSEPKTDYDIYVYNPTGEMESYHTESAGLPEHLGTTVNDPFFVPTEDGNYTFVIINDPKESKGAEAATFMVIEDVSCNEWHEHRVDGKDDSSMPVLNTSWAYEFLTESQRIELWVRVPATLDMYEARLYRMADKNTPNETTLNGVPLAWEPGLFGERNDTLGGYNLESKEFRGVAYASCEHYGENMFLNYTCPCSGKSLYHLVFIGEVGSGATQYLVKTEFENAALLPVALPSRVALLNDTVVAFNSNSTDLVNATLTYSTDLDMNTTMVEMRLSNSNRTCSAMIPGQPAGTTVSYEATALDMLQNLLIANGSFAIKNPSTLNITLASDIVHAGENITVKGFLAPATEDALITIHFNSANQTEQILCRTLADGSFTAGFRTENVGAWEIQATFEGQKQLHSSSSQSIAARVEEPTFLMKYSLYLGGGIAASVVIGAVIYVKKIKQ